MARLTLQFLFAVSIPLFVALALPGEKTEPVLAHDRAVLLAEIEPRAIPGKFTGGFGELTCHNCHFGYDLNHEGGMLRVDGLNETYSPGQEFGITVTVSSVNLEKGGFQMTARLEDGTQAGWFAWADNDSTLMFTPGTGGEVEYIQHSEAGTDADAKHEVSWFFVWTAPDEPAGPVRVNIAANAGNDDLSPFGDRIYVQEFKLNTAP